MLTSISHYLANLLKRILSRLALFLWIKPLVAAISTALTASLYKASTLSAPAATASSIS